MEIYFPKFVSLPVGKTQLIYSVLVVILFFNIEIVQSLKKDLLIYSIFYLKTTD